jgi:hypothetical protein
MSHGKVEGEFLVISPEDYTQLVNKYRDSPRGLGDIVERLARPIAKISDAILHTHLSGCSGCKHRQETLNRLVTFNGGKT